MERVKALDHDGNLTWCRAQEPSNCRYHVAHGTYGVHRYQKQLEAEDSLPSLSPSEVDAEIRRWAAIATDIDERYARAYVRSLDYRQ